MSRMQLMDTDFFGAKNKRHWEYVIFCQILDDFF